MEQTNEEEYKVPSVSGCFYNYYKYTNMNFSEYNQSIPKYRLSGFTDKKFMVSFINSVFDDFGDKLTMKDYSEVTASWSIEYGTKPLEEIVETFKEKNIITTGRRIATEAAEKAIEKFNLFNNEVYDDMLGQYELDYIINRKGWCSLNVELRYDYMFSSYVIILKLNNGGVKALKYVLVKLDEKFKNSYQFCYLRKNYIKLLEGLQVETSRDNILNYLLNQEIVKEVCSFIR